MAYVSGAALKAYAQRPDVLTEAQSVQRLQKSVKAMEATVFLSHSHQDLSYIHESLVLFYSMGIVIYVDYFDPTMPKITCAETAVQLKNRIVACDKFVVLASGNALNSRWVPWELGYADSISRMANIAIFPVEDNNSQWQGSEYMGVYNSIRATGNSQSPGQLAVYRPDGTFVSSLDMWLRQKN